mgnify:CR=1 FL=1
MPRSKQEVFKELYEQFEAVNPIITVALQKEAHSHGIRIEAVEKAALASQEDDYDE